MLILIYVSSMNNTPVGEYLKDDSESESDEDEDATKLKEKY